MSQIKHTRRTDWRIYQRNGVWQIAYSSGGKLRRESLKTSDKALAKDRAEILARGYALDQLDRTKEMLGLTKPKALTIAQALDLFRQEVGATDLLPRTTRNYELALLQVLRAAYPDKDPLALTLDHIDRACATRFAAAMLRGVGQGRARHQRDRAIGSTLNQARSIFGRKVRHVYGTLPAGLYAFLDYRHRSMPVEVNIGDDLLRERTHSEAAKLEENNPVLYLAYLLAFRLALRPRERHNAKWSDLVMNRGQTQLRVTGKRKSRGVPVSSDLLATLHRLKQDETFIAPGGERTTRALSAWMRSVGWVASRFQKSTYNLRRLAASAIATDHDPLTAANILGNTVPVVMKHYVQKDDAISADAIDATLRRRSEARHA